MDGMMEKGVLDDIIRRLLDGRGGKQVQLSEAEIRQLCVNARQIFLSQPNLLQLHAPIRICGKIRGLVFVILVFFCILFFWNLVIMTLNCRWVWWISAHVLCNFEFYWGALMIELLKGFFVFDLIWGGFSFNDDYHGESVPFFELFGLGVLCLFIFSPHWWSLHLSLRI